MSNISNNGSNVLGASGGIAVFTILTAVTGLLVDVFLAALFGLGESTDAFYAAYTVPFFLANAAFVLGQSTLVPLFSRYASGRPDGESGGFLSTYLNIALAAGIALTVFGVLLRESIVRLVAPGVGADVSSLAASLAGVLAVLVVFSLASEVLRSYLYANGMFVVAASSNFVRNTVALAGVWLLHGRYGIMGAAYGFTAGYAAQFAALVIRVYIYGGVSYVPRIDSAAHRFGESARIGMVQTGGFAVLQAETLAERIIGSFLPPGSITALSYASRIVFMLVETLAGSVATATLPVLSRAMGEGDKDRARGILGGTFRAALVMFLPLTALIVALSNPIVSVLYQRGAFTVSDADLTAWVFMLFGLSLVFQGYNRLIHNYLFAALMPRGSLLLFTVLSVVAVVFDVAFVGPLGITAIPLGYLTGAVVACLVGYRAFIGGLGVLPLDEFASYTGRVALLSLSFGGACFMMFEALNGLSLPWPNWSVHLSLAGAIAAGLAIAVIVGTLLGIKELGELYGMLRRRGAGG